MPNGPAGCAKEGGGSFGWRVGVDRDGERADEQHRARMHPLRF